MSSSAARSPLRALVAPPVRGALVLALALAAALSPGACKKDAAPSSEDAAAAPARPSGPPTRAAVLELLRTIDARLSAGEYGALEDEFGIPTGFSAAQLTEHLARLQERREISAEGVDALAARGRFGPAAEIVGPSRAERFATKFGVSAEGCVAFALDTAEVVLCRFPDGRYRIVRLDDVGRVR